MYECACRSDEESGGEIDWDNLGFGLTPTDYMYVMRCSLEDGVFSRGELSRYGNIELSPSSGVINYGQVCHVLQSTHMSMQRNVDPGDRTNK